MILGYKLKDMITFESLGTLGQDDFDRIGAPLFDGLVFSIPKY
jgi:hypothetical protein